MLTSNPLNTFRYCPRCGREGFADHGERAKQCTGCGFTYYHNVASAVACLVRDPQGRYLFVRRAHEPARGTLDLPGGFVDPLETVEMAVVRELAEETGLVPTSMRYIASRPNVYPYSGIDVYTSDLFFLVEVESLDEAVAQDDAAALVVARLEEVCPSDFGLVSIRQFVGEVLEAPLSYAYLYDR